MKLYAHWLRVERCMLVTATDFDTVAMICEKVASIWNAKHDELLLEEARMEFSSSPKGEPFPKDAIVKELKLSKPDVFLVVDHDVIAVDTSIVRIDGQTSHLWNPSWSREGEDSILDVSVDDDLPGLEDVPDGEVDPIGQAVFRNGKRLDAAGLAKDMKQKAFSAPLPDTIETTCRDALEDVDKSTTLPSADDSSGNCAVCSVQLAIPKDAKSVVCRCCDANNLIVEEITAQANCSFCQRNSQRVLGEAVLTCAGCGNGGAICTCPRCNMTFVFPVLKLNDGWKAAGPSCSCANPKCKARIRAPDVEEQQRHALTQRGRRFLVNSDVVAPAKHYESLAADYREFGVELVTQYYVDQNTARQAEIDKCLANNLKNRHIRTVHILLEKDDDHKKARRAITRASDTVAKVQITNLGRRMTVGDAFSYCFEKLSSSTCVIANSDIYFDDSLRRLATMPLSRKLLALSRYDVLANGGIQLNLYLAPMSQDAWVFHSSMIASADKRRLLNLDFDLGKPGTDNRIAHEFSNIGCSVINPCRVVVSKHLHSTNVRNYTPEDKIPGPYLPVNPM